MSHYLQPSRDEKRIGSRTSNTFDRHRNITEVLNTDAINADN